MSTLARDRGRDRDRDRDERDDRRRKRGHDSHNSHNKSSRRTTRSRKNKEKEVQRKDGKALRRSPRLSQKRDQRTRQLHDEHRDRNNSRNRRKRSNGRSSKAHGRRRDRHESSDNERERKDRSRGGKSKSSLKRKRAKTVQRIVKRKIVDVNHKDYTWFNKTCDMIKPKDLVQETTANVENKNFGVYGARWDHETNEAYWWLNTKEDGITLSPEHEMTTGFLKCSQWKSYITRIMIKEGLDHTKPMTYNEYINRLYESESGMPQNVRLCVYFWVNDRYGETGGKNNYMEYSCQINWVDGIDGGELMEHLWQEVYKHCLDPDIEVCSSCAKIRHFYMFHRHNYYIQSAKDWDHMRICPIAPKNDDKWDSSLEFWQTVKYNEKMRFFKSWFSKKPRDVQFRRKKNESLLDTYVSCEFNAIFVTPKHAEFLEGRDERIKEAEKKLKDETLAKLSFPIKGVGDLLDCGDVADFTGKVSCPTEIPSSPNESHDFEEKEETVSDSALSNLSSFKQLSIARWDTAMEAGGDFIEEEEVVEEDVDEQDGDHQMNDQVNGNQVNNMDVDNDQSQSQNLSQQSHHNGSQLSASQLSSQQPRSPPRSPSIDDSQSEINANVDTNDVNNNGNNNLNASNLNDMNLTQNDNETVILNDNEIDSPLQTQQPQQSQTNNDGKEGTLRERLRERNRNDRKASDAKHKRGHDRKYDHRHDSHRRSRSRHHRRRSRSRSRSDSSRRYRRSRNRNRYRSNSSDYHSRSRRRRYRSCSRSRSPSRIDSESEYSQSRSRSGSYSDSNDSRKTTARSVSNSRQFSQPSNDEVDGFKSNDEHQKPNISSGWHNKSRSRSPSKTKDQQHGSESKSGRSPKKNVRSRGIESIQGNHDEQQPKYNNALPPFFCETPNGNIRAPDGTTFNQQFQNQLVKLFHMMNQQQTMNNNNLNTNNSLRTPPNQYGAPNQWSGGNPNTNSNTFQLQKHSNNYMHQQPPRKPNVSDHYCSKQHWINQQDKLLVNRNPIWNDVEYLNDKLKRFGKYSDGTRTAILRGILHAGIAAHNEAAESGSFRDWDKIVKKAKKGEYDTLRKLSEKMSCFQQEIPTFPIFSSPEPPTPTEIRESNSKQPNKSGSKADLRELAGYMKTISETIPGGEDDKRGQESGNQSTLNQQQHGKPSNPRSPTPKAKSSSKHFIYYVQDVCVLLTLMQAGKNLTIIQIVEAGYIDSQGFTPLQIDTKIRSYRGEVAKYLWLLVEYFGVPKGKLRHAWDCRKMKWNEYYKQAVKYATKNQDQIDTRLSVLMKSKTLWKDFDVVDWASKKDRYLEDLIPGVEMALCEARLNLDGNDITEFEKHEAITDYIKKKNKKDKQRRIDAKKRKREEDEELKKEEMERLKKLKANDGNAVNIGVVRDEDETRDNGDQLQNQNENQGGNDEGSGGQQ